MTGILHNPQKFPWLDLIFTTFCNSGVFTEEPVTSEWELMICQIINHEAMNIKFRSDYQIIMMNDCGWESVDVDGVLSIMFL